MIDGIHWNRIDSRDPSFNVFELNGDRLDGYLLQAGGKKVERGTARHRTSS
jgi:hypothetical protein